MITKEAFWIQMKITSTSNTS